MVGIEDYSEDKAELRWTNDRHCQAHEEYQNGQSPEFIEDTQAYYRSLDRPIDRTKWEYLKQRKAWFHPPVGWNEFCAPGVSRILDLGCGDGDLTQRVADHIAGCWLRAGYDGYPLEIVGIDINESRLSNARRHTDTPHEKISLRFEPGNALKKLDYEEHYFDFTLANGLCEILDDSQLNTVLNEINRLTARGVYVRDVLESYPGITPRPELPEHFSSMGFSIQSHHRVFEEPFTEEGSKDPLEVWPMNVNQVIFGVRPDPISTTERY